MSGDTALCLACGTGEMCEQAKSVERMRAGFGELEEIPPPTCRTIVITDADRVVTEVAPVTAWAIKASLDPENLKRGLTRSQRAPLAPRTDRERRQAKVKVVKEAKPKMARAVKAVKPEEVAMEKMELEAAKARALEMFNGGAKIGDIATATGYSWAGVQYWLRDAGVLPAAGTVKGGGKKKVGAAKKPPTPVGTARLAPATVGIQLTERNLDAFWAKCSLAEKARAFSAMFEAR